MATSGIVSSLFGGEPPYAGVFEPRPSTIPSGFDCLIQISAPLMNRALAANLGAWNLNILSARVPYQPELTSAKLRALIQPLLGGGFPSDRLGSPSEGLPFLEVQVLNPTPQALVWPAPADLGGAASGTNISTRS